jgi:pullulanase
MLANGILAVSQGVMMLHSGQDFARYKFQDENSYQAGDQINQIDWTRKKTYNGLFQYTKGLIEMRRAHPVFRLRTADEIRSRLVWIVDSLPAPETIVFLLDGEELAGETWTNAAVFINPTTSDLTFRLPLSGPARIYVHNGRAGNEPFGTVEGSITVPARSMSVVAQ